MAGDSTIDSEKFYLLDKWPGTPRDIPPFDNFTSTSAGHNSETPKYALGTKVRVQCNGSTGGPGESTFIYLKLEAQSSHALAKRHIVVQHSEAGNGGDEFFDVTNDTDHDITAQKGPIAVALSAMTTDYYGWFWCGGVCPEQYVSDLGGNYITTGAVALGDMTWADAASPGANGEFAFDVADAAGETVIGYAVAADAA